MANYTDSVAVAIVGDLGVLQGVGNKLKHFCRSSSGTTTTVRWYDFRFRDKIHGIHTSYVEASWKIWIFGGRYLALCELHPDKDNDIRLIARSKLSDVISSVAFVHYKTLDVVTTYNVALRVQLNDANRLEIVRKSVCEERSTLYCSHIVYDDVDGDWEQVLVFGGTAFGEVLIWRPHGSGKSAISYRFATSRGVLFSIATNMDFTKVYTTSDDRSVRFWNLNWGKQTDGRKIIVGHELELSCFGHMGRVFRSVLLPQGLLLTVGEDSRLCGWDMQGKLVFRRDFQSGASLWNLAVTVSSSSQDGIIYVTTSNGGLEVLSLVDVLRKNTLTCLSGDDLFHGDNCYPAKIRFLSQDKIVCVTSKDELRMLSKAEEEDEKWVVSFILQLDFKTTVLEVSGSYIALGGFKRVCIYQYQEEAFVLHAQSQEIGSLVRAVHWIEDTSQLLAVDDKGDGCLFSNSLELLKTVSLSHGSPGKERWSTSVLSMSKSLLIGDRHGSLHCFDASADGISAPLRGTSLRRVHSSLGITGMHKVAEECFMTTGHDSMLRTIHLNESSGKLSIWRSQRVPIKWIERVDGDLVIGFNDNHFTIWNRQERRMVLELDCGGGHRFWDLIRGEGEAGKLIYIKNRQLFLADVPLHSKRATLPNSVSHWHTTSTNCMNLWTLMGCQFVLSGGEEGLIKVHALIGDSLVYRDEMTSHIANIRSMDLRELNETTSLLFTGGGRAQLCVHRLEKTMTGLEVRECCNYMLKKTELEKGGRKKKNNQEVDFDPETRLMCLLVDKATIYAGCSDGYIRVLEYNEKEQEMKLISETFYGKCVLQMTRLPVEDKLVLMTAATDGKINFWMDGSFDKPVFQLDHHESGINAFDCSRVKSSKEAKKDEFWIVTGGDDQGLVWSRIRYDGGFELQSTVKQPFRHTAQVSGIWIQDDKFISVSVDQEVFEHSLVNSEDYRNISFTSVSDAKGLAMIDERGIVYGAGVEIIDVKLVL